MGKTAKVLEGIILKTKTNKGDCMRYVMTIYEDKSVFIQKYIYSNLPDFKNSDLFKEQWSRYGKTLYYESMGFKGIDFIRLHSQFNRMFKKNAEKFKIYNENLENNED